MPGQVLRLLCKSGRRNLFSIRSIQPMENTDDKPNPGYSAGGGASGGRCNGRFHCGSAVCLAGRVTRYARRRCKAQYQAGCEVDTGHTKSVLAPPTRGCIGKVATRVVWGTCFRRMLPRHCELQQGAVMAGEEGVGKSSEAVSGPPGTSAPDVRSRQVFLSYASADAVTAQQICEFLEARGVFCWIAPRDVKPGAQRYSDHG